MQMSSNLAGKASKACRVIAKGAFCKLFAGKARGVAAIEFAVSISVLVIAVIGVVEVTQLVRADMKLRHATEAFAKMASQMTVASDANMSPLCYGASQMMLPFQPTSFKAAVMSVSNVAGAKGADWGSAYVCNGGSVASAAMTEATGMIPNPTDSMLAVTGAYTYTPMFGFIIHAAVPLTHSVMFRPRSQVTIPRS